MNATAGILERKPITEGDREEMRSASEGIHRAARLALALHRMTQDQKTGCNSTPECILAWEIFLSASVANEKLGRVLGYGAEEADYE